jgi:D-sedoheptulose 7-phosphate isomerase
VSSSTDPTDPTDPTEPQAGGGAETLYPFLAGGPAGRRTDVETVMADIRRSTVAKVEEIAALRQECLTRFGDGLDRCARDLAVRLAAGARLFAFGNGGSSTDAQDLAALFLSGGGTGRPLPALCLTADVAAVTALANDVAFDVVFARQLAALARPGDVAVGLSTSGNSANLIRAFEVAARQGLLTIGFAGYEGGQMAEMDVLDYLFVVPSASVHRIQEAQTTLYQALWELTVSAVEDEEAYDQAGGSPGPRGSPG